MIEFRLLSPWQLPVPYGMRFSVTLLHSDCPNVNQFKCISLNRIIHMLLLHTMTSFRIPGHPKHPQNQSTAKQLRVVMGKIPSGQIPFREIIIIYIILLNLHILMTTLLPHWQHYYIFLILKYIFINENVCISSVEWKWRYIFKTCWFVNIFNICVRSSVRLFGIPIHVLILLLLTFDFKCR